jgi:hypothetical protein
MVKGNTIEIVLPTNEKQFRDVYAWMDIAHGFQDY